MNWLVILLTLLIIAICVRLRQVQAERDDYMAWFEHQRQENIELWRKYHRTKKRLDQAEDALIEAMKQKPRAKS